MPITSSLEKKDLRRLNWPSVCSSSAVGWPGILTRNKTTAAVTAPRGRLIQKHQRHVARSVKMPPKVGARIWATPLAALKMPAYLGRLCRGRLTVIMTTPPQRTPAHPIPAIALPMISVTEFGAAAQNIEPTSNKPRAQRKIVLRGNVA